MPPVNSRTFQAMFGRQGNFVDLDFDIDTSRTTGGRLTGSGLRGIIRWSPGPEILAKAVEECGTRLLNNIGRASEQVATEMRKDARMLAESKYVNPSTPDIASANLSTRRGGTLTRFDIALFHGTATQKRGHHYGANLEREANQYGSYGHSTEVIMPMIQKWGREMMKKCDGALVRGTAGGSTNLQRRIERMGITGV